MAMDWIKWECGLASKPEVIAMAARLDLDRWSVAGRLMEIWEWAGRNLADGAIDPEIFGLAPESGEKASRENRAPSASAFLDTRAHCAHFAAAMIAVKWLKIDKNGRLIFPNWDRHNSQSAKRRALNARRATAYRDRNASRSHRAKIAPEARSEKRRELVTPPTPPRGGKCARKGTMEKPQEGSGTPPPKPLANERALRAFREMTADDDDGSTGSAD